MLPYTVHCSLSILAAADDFFSMKKFCVRRGDRYPDANPAYSVRQNTCLRNMANSFYRLFAVRRFFVCSPLFRYCLRIVYSGLYDYSGLRADRRSRKQRDGRFLPNVRRHFEPSETKSKKSNSSTWRLQQPGGCSRVKRTGNSRIVHFWLEEPAGGKLVQFCQKHNLKIVNIFFKKRSGKRWTWVVPNQQFKSQTDCILAPPLTFNLISNFDTSNKFKFHSDHRPIFIKIEIKKFRYFTKKHNQNARPSKPLSSQYQAKLDQKLEEVL